VHHRSFSLSLSSCGTQSCISSKSFWLQSVSSPGFCPPSSLLFFSSMFPEPRRQKMAGPKKIQKLFPRENSAKHICLLYVFSSPSKEHLDDDDHVLPSAHRQVWRVSGDVFFFVWDDAPTGILDDGSAAWSRVVVVVVVDQRENDFEQNQRSDFEARRTRANVRVRGEESAERAASGTRTEHGVRSGKCAGEGETTERERAFR